MNVYFKEIEKIYKNLKERRSDYYKDKYKWRLGVGIIRKIENEHEFFRYVDCTGVKNTLFGMAVEIDYLDPCNIQIFENITDEIGVVIDNYREKNNKLEKAKEIIKKNFRYGDCGLFKSRNVFGDPMHNIYNADGLKIDICFCHSYFEVFGLNDEEFKELKEYYIKLDFESEEK